MDRYIFAQRQSWPYEYKLRHAIDVANSFYDKITLEKGANVHVSVGGLDSITLLLFLRKYVDKDIKAISVSSIEHTSIQRIHRLLGVEAIKPLKNKVQILSEYGFPVISKEKAGKIHALQNPTDKNATVRHAIMTGDTGAQGGYRTGTRMRLPLKWLKKFGGYENEKYGTNYGIPCPHIPVSNECCHWLKEKPCDDWAKANNSYPYLGLMASEGGQREKALIKNGCNYYGKSRKAIRSCPFAIFMRDDLLRLAVELEVPVPEAYGIIESYQDENDIQHYHTTEAQRTGCEMCGFGIHIEKRPHRFDRLRAENPKAWEFWMYKCVPEEWHYETAQETDENGNVVEYQRKIVTKSYGWGRVLDYIGVKWEDEYRG